MVKQIEVWTDGGCRNHGNVKGGHVKPTDSAACAFLIKYPNGVTIHRSRYFKGETNNAMELQGVIDALTVLTNNGVCKVKAPRVVVNTLVTTDSKYIYDALTKRWVDKWRKRKFKHVKNADRWIMLLYLLAHVADVRFKWVKGHAKDKGNIFVDHLLNQKMNQVEHQRKAGK